MTQDGPDGGTTGYHEDPGWPSGALLLRLLLPFGHLTLMRADGGRAPIVQLRLILLSFVASLVLLLLVVGFVLPAEVTATDDPLAWILLAVGAVTAVAGATYARRGLACGPPEQLVGRFRTSFFVAAALVQSAALFGFVAAFTVDALWPYPAGLVLSAIGFAAFAPTRGRIAAMERDLQSRGCPHSLAAGLYSTLGGD